MRCERLCALREPPEQCERDAERARSWGVTSPLSLIRRAACAARRRGHNSPDPHSSADTGVGAPWVPGSPCGSSGPDRTYCQAAHTLGVKVDPPPTGSHNRSCSFKFLNIHPDSCVNFCKYILLHLFWGFWGRQEEKKLGFWIYTLKTSFLFVESRGPQRIVFYFLMM